MLSTTNFQVSYNIDKNKEHEIKGLLEAMNAFRLKKGLIITDDYENTEKIDGKTIEYIPLWRWPLRDHKGQ